MNYHYFNNYSLNKVKIYKKFYDLSFTSKFTESG